MKQNDFFSVIRNDSYEKYKEIVSQIDVNICNEYGQNGLHEAIESNRLDIAKDLILRGVNVNHQDRRGQVPLHYCAQYKNANIAELLLQKKANVNSVDCYGNGPLWTAVFNSRGDYQIVKLFVRFGADAHHLNKALRSPLSFAQQINDSELIGILTNAK